MLIHYYHSVVSRNFKMEYISKEYRHSIGKFAPSQMDINIFVQKSKRNTCISNRNIQESCSCKETSRPNLETDLITPLNQHNYGI